MLKEREKERERECGPFGVRELKASKTASEFALRVYASNWGLARIRSPVDGEVVV